MTVSYFVRHQLVRGRFNCLYYEIMNISLRGLANKTFCIYDCILIMLKTFQKKRKLQPILLLTLTKPLSHTVE